MLVEWKSLKAFADLKALNIQYVDRDEFYHVIASDSSIVLHCYVYKKSSDDLDDFDTNYKPTANKPVVSKVAQIMGDGGTFSMRPRGFSGTATANQTTDIDYQVPINMRFRGGVLYAENATMGDSVSMTVIDKDNILGLGADTVLAEYVTDWQVIPNQPNIVEDVDLSNELLSGLYFRLSYTNTHATNNVKILLNFYAYVQD